MPRKRKKENKGFPPRWKWVHGAIYYQVPPDCKHLWDGKSTFRLGKTPSEAYKAWAKRIEWKKEAQFMSDIFDRYILEVLPTLKIRTQTNYLNYMPRIREAFGEMIVANPNKESYIEPHHGYTYVNKRSSKKLAIKEIRFLSAILSVAVEWGEIKRNPLKGQLVFRGSGSTNNRYIEDWEIQQILSIKSCRKKRRNFVDVVKAYIRIKNLIGLRKIDMLRIKEANLKEDGIHIVTSKNGKSVVFSWTQALKDAVEEARQARPAHISPWLFCTRFGACYVNEKDKMDGFDSNWQRFKKRVLAETKITLNFTEHDLRGKVGSDSKSTLDAQKLLTHSDARTTERHYRRKPEMVSPLR